MRELNHGPSGCENLAHASLNKKKIKRKTKPPNSVHFRALVSIKIPLHLSSGVGADTALVTPLGVRAASTWKLFSTLCSLRPSYLHSISPLQLVTKLDLGACSLPSENSEGVTTEVRAPRC